MKKSLVDPMQEKDRLMKMEHLLSNNYVIAGMLIVIDLLLFFALNYVSHLLVSLPGYLLKRITTTELFSLRYLFPAVASTSGFLVFLFVAMVVDVILVVRIKIAWGEENFNVGQKGRQRFTTPEETFKKLSKRLEQRGVLVFSTFGKFNLREIRLTTGGGLDYRNKEELEKMLKPYFEIELIEEEFHMLEFDTPLAVLQHLKKTGVNVSGDPTIWTKGRVDAFIKDYNARFAIDGKVALTYHPLYFVCRRK